MKEINTAFTNKPKLNYRDNKNKVKCITQNENFVCATFLIQGTKGIKQRMADPHPDKMLLLLSCQQSVIEIRVAFHIPLN